MEWVDLPFEEAIKFLRQRWPVLREVWDELALDIRNRAFTMSRTMVMSVIQDSLDHLIQMLETGGTLAEFADRLDEVFAASGISDLEPWYAETVFRTGVQAAYGRGRWEQGQDPDIKDELAGWQYHAVMDDRTRPEHAALDGQLFPVEGGAAVFPPWDFNCRCSASWITKDEAIAKGWEASEELPDEVQEKMRTHDFASPALGDIYNPDLAGIHPRVIEDFVNETQRRTQ